MIKPSIFVYGHDGVGWSIDADRHYTELLLKEAGFSLSKNPLTADVIHFVWWNQAYQYRHIKKVMGSKKWIAVVTNTIRKTSIEFEKLRSTIDLWIAANRAQERWFFENDIRCSYQPFYVDERVFHPIRLDRKALCASFGLDANALSDRILIGSFQRDTQANLVTPKWQKGPETLIEILRTLEIPRQKWCLLLAGPRRHWVISECERLNIPYIFIGDRPRKGVDDIFYNRLDKESMAFLYNLVDVYVIASQQEGGPKAVMESALCRTPVISTGVGLAPDMLTRKAIYSSVAEGQQLLADLMYDSSKRGDLAVKNYDRVHALNNRGRAVARWQNMYHELLGVEP